MAEALRLADLWLDQVTELPSGVDRTAAWSRVEWVEQTLPAWGSHPIAPGTPVEAPTPIFTKLDVAAVVEEELERLKR